LHLALTEAKLTWREGGIQELVHANPDALRTIDPTTGLYPFQEAARHATRSRSHISTLLELLLAAPELVDPNRHK
jgi:hypothetical protein